MTAEDRGRSAVDLGLASISKLKGYWLAVTFALGGLFWLHDTWVAVSRLPPLVEVQGERIVLLESRVHALAQSLYAAMCGTLPIEAPASGGTSGPTTRGSCTAATPPPPPDLPRPRPEHD